MTPFEEQKMLEREMEKNSEGRQKYTPTTEMLQFFMDASREYALGTTLEKATPVEHFDFIVNKMLESNDPNIKLHFSKCLMFIGFNEMISQLAKSIMQIMGGKDKVSMIADMLKDM